MISASLLRRIALVLVAVAMVTVGGAAAALVLGVAPSGDAFWWSWTRVLDTGLLTNDISFSGRVLATLVSLAGLALIGVLLAAVVEDGAKRFVEDLFAGKRPDRDPDVVIFGSGSKAAWAVEAFPGKHCVIAAPDTAALAATELLAKGVSVVVGRVGEPGHRARLKLDICERIIVFDDGDHDAGPLLAALPSFKARRQPLIVHLELSDSEMADDLATLLDDRSAVDVRPFSIADEAARHALLQHPLDARPLTRTSRVWLVVWGRSAFAEALLRRALRTAHFVCEPRLQVVMIGDEAEEWASLWRAEVPSLDDLVSLQTLVAAPRQGVGSAVGDCVTLLVCGRAADETMARAFQARTLGIEGLAQVLVDLQPGSGYRNLGARLAGCHFVGTAEMGTDSDRLAIELHTTYLSSRKKKPDFPSKMADKEWHHLPSTARNWNRSTADHQRVKLRALSDLTLPPAVAQEVRQEPRLASHPDIVAALDRLAASAASLTKELTANPEAAATDRDLEALAELEHRRWMAEKRAEGWVYGATRDDDRKRHTDLRPYDELPQDVRNYDRDVVVKTLSSLIRGSPV
jgi:hypothetical protein